MDGRFFDMDSQITALRDRESRIPVALKDEFARRLEQAIQRLEIALHRHRSREDHRIGGRRAES